MCFPRSTVMKQLKKIDMSGFLCMVTSLFSKNILLNANFVVTCAFITEKRANVVYPKIFYVFVSDWPKFLINIYEKSLLSPQMKQVRRACVKTCSKVVRRFGAKESRGHLELKTLGRRTEKFAP